MGHQYLAVVPLKFSGKTAKFQLVWLVGFLKIWNGFNTGNKKGLSLERFLCPAPSAISPKAKEWAMPPLVMSHYWIASCGSFKNWDVAILPSNIVHLRLKVKTSLPFYTRMIESRTWLFLKLNIPSSIRRTISFPPQFSHSHSKLCPFKVLLKVLPKCLLPFYSPIWIFLNLS